MYRMATPEMSEIGETKDPSNLVKDYVTEETHDKTASCSFGKKIKK